MNGCFPKEWKKENITVNKKVIDSGRQIIKTKITHLCHSFLFVANVQKNVFNSLFKYLDDK